jgi:hypothetical protein
MLVLFFFFFFVSLSYSRSYTVLTSHCAYQSPTLLVDENSFKLLLYLFCTVLRQQDLAPRSLSFILVLLLLSLLILLLFLPFSTLSVAAPISFCYYCTPHRDGDLSSRSNSKDFRACRILMMASCALCRRLPDSSLDYIQVHFSGESLLRLLSHCRPAAHRQLRHLEEHHFLGGVLLGCCALPLLLTLSFAYALADEVERKYNEQCNYADLDNNFMNKITQAFNTSLVPIIISSFGTLKSVPLPPPPTTTFHLDDRYSVNGALYCILSPSDGPQRTT